jgi:acylphosphatase
VVTGAGLQPGPGPQPDVRLTAWVHGRVQGVGFRWWCRARARELGLTGYAENLEDGRVKVVAEGPEYRCRELLGRLESRTTPGRVSRVTHRFGASCGEFPSFTER